MGMPLMTSKIEVAMKRDQDEEKSCSHRVFKPTNDGFFYPNEFQAVFHLPVSLVEFYSSVTVVSQHRSTLPGFLPVENGRYGPEIVLPFLAHYTNRQFEAATSPKAELH